MDINNKILAIAEDKNISVGEKIAAIVDLHQTIQPDTDEFYQVGVVAYEAVRSLLLNDNYEDCHLGDLLMCNSLLAESYWRTGRSWLIAPLAQHIYDMLLGVTTDDDESLKMIVAVIDRICYVLQSHPRLTMKLYAQQYRFEKMRKEPNKETLEEAANNIISLSTLTGDDTWYAPIKDELIELLGSAMVQEIVDNPYTGNLKVDEVEYTEAYENAIDAVEEEVARRMGNQPYAMGMCFEIWSIKKEILLEKYKIEWRTPSQMNPRVMFD